MNIISLEAENILRLSAIRIQANGQNVTLTGKNGSGKTSVLRCIEMALGGKDLVSEKPVKEGAEKGKIVLDLGTFVVTRTFTKAGGTTLNVTTPEKAKFPTPQSILDGLVGQLSFDPLEFARLGVGDSDDKTKQLRILKTLVGLDFTALDHERKQCYDSRTIVNRDVDRAKAQLQGMQHFVDAPETETPSSTILEELNQANTHNAGKATLERKVEGAHRSLEAQKSVCLDLESEIDRLEKAMATAKAALTTAEALLPNLKDAKKEALAGVAAFVPVDTSKLSEKLSGLDESNRKVRANAQHAKGLAEVSARQQESEKLTARIAAIDAEKQSKLEATTFPVDGLSFTDSGVLYRGLPFEQASAAEQLRVSCAMGMALNPKLKIITIRDGSLLDDEMLAAITELAKEKQYQLWIERVSSGKEVSVTIEDGEEK
jgi:energy-coupling factor transporter ATP-binding protein EcfA2